MTTQKYDSIRLEADRYPFGMIVVPRFADMGNDLLFRKRNYRLLVAKASYDYLHEAHYPQPLEARVGVVHIGNSSFELALALFQEGRCVCLADVVAVHVTDNGPAPLLAELKTKLQSRLLRRD